MRISVTRGSWLVPLLALMPLVQGCGHKTPPAQSQTLAPPIVDAPPPKPAPVTPADLPPPVIGPPEDSQTAEKDTAPKPPAPAKKPVHHPKSTTPAGNTPPPQQAGQEAANTAPATTPSVSAIGELSGGASGDQRSQTEETINTTEKGVNAINRGLNDSETKTAAQIREFLKQARQALTSGDVDGALTLAKKAKVLLAELSNQ
jgi:hypothetical protein